jgi:hypothetical protein
VKNLLNATPDAASKKFICGYTMITIDLNHAKSIIEQDGGFQMTYKPEYNTVALAHARLGQTVGRFYLNYPEDNRKLLLALRTMERRIAKRAARGSERPEQAQPNAVTV